MMPYIRMKDIADSDLSPDDKIELMAIALEDLALAQTMSIVHGDRWQRKYIEAGGKVRFVEEPDGTQEPCIWCTHTTAQAVDY